MSEPSDRKREWTFYLDDMIAFGEKVSAYSQGLDQQTFVGNSIVYDATIRNLELIGEAATRIPDIELIPDTDVEVFLLHLASRQAQAMPGMTLYLEGWQPPTWQVFGAVLRALIWWGVQQYVEQIAGMIEEIRCQHGSAWNMMLDLDLADLNPPHGTAVWKDLDAIPAERKAQMQSVLDRQPAKSLATAPAREWLSKRRDSPRPPTTHPDWAAIAEVSDWVGRWGIDGHLLDWLAAVDLNLVPEDLELRMIADLLRGCWELRQPSDDSLARSIPGGHRRTLSPRDGYPLD